MKNQFRPLLALLVILPLAIILTLQTIATPRGEADEGIERRRRLLEQQAEKLERAIESSIETKGPEANEVRRNLDYQRKAIGQKLAELDLLAESENRDGDERRRRRDRDEDDEDDERRRRDRDEDDEDWRRRDRDEDDDREVHLKAAIEHLQGAGFSARTARHIIAEAMRLEDKGDAHHEVDRRRHAEEDEHHHREREGDDEDKFHDRAHHETATQLKALRREVAELRQLVEKMRNRR